MVNPPPVAVPEQDWHIPRPTLMCTDPAYPYVIASGCRGSPWDSTGRGSASSGSTTSTQAGSGCLLMGSRSSLHPVMVPNTWLIDISSPINRNDKEYLNKQQQLEEHDDPGSVSLASSTHFTVIGVEKTSPRKTCCQAHQLTALVLSMSLLILVGIIAAILYMEVSRWE